MELWPGVNVGWGFVGGGSLAWQHLVSSLDVSKVVSLRNSSILFFVFFVFLVHQCLFLGFWCVECWYYLVYVFIYFVPY